MSFYIVREPPVIHFVGGSKKQYLNELYVGSKTSIQAPQDVDIITFGQPQNIYCPLIDQLNLSGVNYINLAENEEKWNNSMKIEYTLKSLERCVQKYVCILDATDICLTPNFKNIIPIFNSINCELLFSSCKYNLPGFKIEEDIVWPDRDDYAPSKYINTGCILGLRDRVTDFFQFTFDKMGEFDNPNGQHSDQYFIRNALIAYPDINRLSLDYKQLITQSVLGYNIAKKTTQIYFIEEK